ncbi:MAG: Verru_Chthon cassette protein D [Chthoniobacteraceae bacterium]|nr:Verru_Chthon cassette protein D [Chthoniobacteraceae bacterium]
MHVPASSPPRPPRGFSLIEILLVLSIASILMTLSVSSVQKMIHSTDLTSSAVTVVDAFNLARQQALSSNHPVEVRVYKVPPKNGTSLSGSSAFRALGVYQINENGPQLVNKLIYLNGNTEIAATQSFGTLLFYAPSLTASLPGVASNSPCEYRSFQYHPDGSTDLNPQPPSASDTWHVMIYNADKPPTDSMPPANYISVQLDPVSGRTETFQPGM